MTARTVTAVRTSDYWARRMLAVAAEQQSDDEALYRRIKRDYEAALHNLDSELSVFYARYAANEEITMADARRLLSNAELENFKMSLDEFRDKAISGGWDKELNEIYLRSRVSRLQALQTQIEARVMDLYQSQRDILRDHLTGAYADAYYRTIYEINRGVGMLTTFAKLDAETVESVISRPWVGDSFSGRIWKDRDKLSRELETTLSQAIVRGDPLQRTAKLLAKRMGVAESRAMTLVSTESAHAAAEATMRSYKETGVEQYQFLAGLDLKTCDVCGALDKKVFRRSEAQVGVNYPIMHPRCRCTTAPISDFEIGTERAARDPVTGKTVYIDKNMTYKEWHKKYVDEVPEAALAEKMYKHHTVDQKQWREYRDVIGKNAPKSLEDFQRIKYTNRKEWRQLMENKRLFSKIDNTVSYSDEYKGKLKQTYEYFIKEGFEFREHALNRVLGQKSGKDKFSFTREDLLRVLKNPCNYRQPNGKQIRFYDGIAVVSADDTGEIVSVVVKNAARKDWEAL